MSRNVALDFLKIILAFMVVGLHAKFLNDITLMGEDLTVNGVFRIAVPIFLVIGGFYFYPIIVKERSVSWIKRVISLYFFWMLFYSYFWFRPSEASLIELLGIVEILFTGYLHLWYLPGMLGAALLVMLLKKLSLKLMISAILFTFMVGVVIQYAGNYHTFENSMLDKWFNTHWVHRNFLFFSFPFFCIGFLINKFNVHEKVSLRDSAILSVTGFFLLIIEAYLNYISPLRDGGFDNLVSLLVVCPAIFLLFMNLDFQGKSKKLALYSIGVYFIHPFILSIYRNVADFHATALTFYAIISSIFVSYFLIKINKRVKFIL